MNSLWTVVATVACACLAVGLPFGDLEGRVIGGSNAREGQYPYMVSLRLNRTGAHFCGASIINSRWILTAAHCVFNVNVSDFYIVAGTHQLNYQRGEVYGVKSIKVNQYFNYSITGNDTATVKIYGDFNFSNPNISQVALARNYIYGGVNLTAMGFGRYDLGSAASLNTLQQLNMTTVSHSDCFKVLGVSTTELCVFKAIGTGVCNGDSGSPIVIQGTNQQVGIASWVAGCAFGKPDVYTRVGNYTNWILNNTDSWNSTQLF